MKAIMHSLLFITIFFFPLVMEAQESPFGDHYWEVVSLSISPAVDVDMDGNADTDLRFLIPPCEKDDTHRYQNDGTIITNRGKIKCEDDEEKIEEVGTWTYDKNTKKLIIDKYETEATKEAIVEAASGSKIVYITHIESPHGGHTVRATLKAVKK